MDEFKDLKVGDAVRYENVYVHDGLRITGQGKVFGFGKFGFTDIVWIKMESGEMRGIAYEEVIKL